MKALLDTSVMIASIRQNHPQHQRAFPWRERIARGEVTGVLAAHSIAEVYSVLTRMPPPLRLPPQLAWRAIELALPSFELATLTESEVIAVLADLSARHVAGGAVYDALIAAVARKADVDFLLTLNINHFVLVAPDLTDRIREP